MNTLDLLVNKQVSLANMIKVSILLGSRHRHLVIEVHTPVIQVPLDPVKLVDLVMAYGKVIQVMHNQVIDPKLDYNQEYSLHHQLLAKRMRLGLSHHKLA